MKKMYSIILFITFCFSALSCSLDSKDNVFGFEDNKPAAEKLWEKQLKNFINKKTRGNSEKLYLVSYEYQGEITSTDKLNSIVDLMFADSAYMALTGPNYDFTINTISFVKDSLKQLENDFIRIDTALLNLKKEVQMHFTEMIEYDMNVYLVNIKWLYNGNAFSSPALATDSDGILFDMIGTYIIEEPKLNTFSNDLTSFAIVKNLSESDDGTSIPDTIRIYDTGIVEIENILGRVAFEYQIYCKSVFFNNSGKLADRSSFVNSDPKFGYNGTAHIEFNTNCKINESTYNEFKWAWGYAPNIKPFTISYENMEFTIYGAEESGKGTEVHRL